MEDADKAKIFFGLGVDIDVQPQEKVEEYERMQEKMEQDKRLAEYKNSGVPEKFWNESFATYDVGNTTSGSELAYVRDTVMEFAKNPRNRVLILCKNNGCGKSHLACSVIRECGGEYITSSLLCMKYDSAIGFKVDMNREELIQHYSKVNMLVIDECCKYVNETTEKFLLMQIICMRYENNKPTVLVTNAEKETFIKFLGRACYDRLTEVGTTLTFDWQSRRKERRNG